MANKTGPEGSVGSPIRTRVQANEAGQAQPALAANVVSIAQEVGGFVATFYSVPSDVLDTPAVKDQIQRQKDKPAGGPIDVTLQLQPAAKLFLPITTVAALVQLLSDNFRAWNDTYARELRNFLDSAKPAPEAGTDGSRKGNG